MHILMDDRRELYTDVKCEVQGLAVDTRLKARSHTTRERLNGPCPCVGDVSFNEPVRVLQDARTGAPTYLLKPILKPSAISLARDLHMHPLTIASDNLGDLRSIQGGGVPPFIQWSVMTALRSVPHGAYNHAEHGVWCTLSRRVVACELIVDYVCLGTGKVRLYAPQRHRSYDIHLKAPHAVGYNPLQACGATHPAPYTTGMFRTWFNNQPAAGFRRNFFGDYVY